MLIFNPKSKAYEYSDDYLEKYIAQRANQTTHLNPTQVDLVVRTLSNFIDLALATDHFKLNQVLTLVQLMAETNQAGVDTDKRLMKTLIELGKSDNSIPLRTLSQQSAVPYQLCIGKLRALNLESLQSAQYISDLQIKAVHTVLKNIFSNTLNALETLLANHKMAFTARTLSQGELLSQRLSFTQERKLSEPEPSAPTIEQDNYEQTTYSSWSPQHQ